MVLLDHLRLWVRKQETGVKTLVSETETFVTNLGQGPRPADFIPCLCKCDVWLGIVPAYNILVGYPTLSATDVKSIIKAL